MAEKYKGTPMVGWFNPVQLFSTAMKAVVSGTFGNYADRREMEAALNNNDKEEKEMAALNAEYSKREEIWIDVISDTGDGFNSTYSVALLAAQNELIVEVDGKEKRLPRGKILCFGGDQIYPTPRADAYEQKFRTPFRAALPLDENDQDRPHLYAIPGNHDWYDGLSAFIKVFCQQRWIGNWMTKQRRSYFALQLPNHCWLWATDIQLSADIDQPQLDYFRNIAENKMQNGDKVIMITAEPGWIYRQIFPEDKSYERMKYFIEAYITQGKNKRVEKKFELVATLTGDLHHYSYYCSTEQDGTKKNHFIGAGGGGAFMHLTNSLPEKLTRLDEKNVTLQHAFPSKKESRKLLADNLIFPFKNFSFALLMSGFYLIVAWLAQTFSHFLTANDFLNGLANAGNISGFYHVIQETILNIPPVLVLSLVLVGGLVGFTDTLSGKKLLRLAGFLHGMIQLAVMFLVFWLLSRINIGALNLEPTSALQVFLFIAECIFIGGMASGFIMGIYLYCCNRFLNIHIDEASSSLAEEDFKNFLRIHVSKTGIEIYPIGIEKVLKLWSTEGVGEHQKFSSLTANKIPQYKLIHDPILIP